MEKIIRFLPAYDKRDSDPLKNFGIHGVTLQMFLKGELGTIQFIVYTNWHLPHVQKTIKHKHSEYGDGTFCPFKPMPAEIGYHSSVPLYDDQIIMSEDCEWTGGRCYYDVSCLDAEKVFDSLTKGGSDGVWKIMEERYVYTFKELR